MKTGTQKTWLITGVSSGFGKELARQALERGDRVIGTVRSTGKIRDLLEQWPDTFSYRTMELTDIDTVSAETKAAFKAAGRIDYVVSNAGYGLYGAAEEFSAEEIDHVIATNLRGSIAFIHAALPFLRKQRSGRIIQVSSVAGQVGYLGNSLYCATKFGIEGYLQCVRLEMEPFGVGVTIVEPGGARTDFRYGGAKVAKGLMPEYAHAHGFLTMLDASKGLAPGDPAKMAARILESTEMEPAPLHLALGTLAWNQIVEELSGRLCEYRTLRHIAYSTDAEPD